LLLPPRLLLTQGPEREKDKRKGGEGGEKRETGPVVDTASRIPTFSNLETGRKERKRKTNLRSSSKSRSPPALRIEKRREGKGKEKKEGGGTFTTFKSAAFKRLTTPSYVLEGEERREKNDRETLHSAEKLFQVGRREQIRRRERDKKKEGERGRNKKGPLVHRCVNLH